MGGTQERKCDFIKIFFHLYVNGRAQERIFNYLKKFCLYCTLIHVCILNIITRIRVCYLHCTLIHVCILNIITRIRVCYLYCTLIHECILNIITQEMKI